MKDKGKSLDQLEEKYFGPKGTENRDNYEKEVVGGIKKENNKKTVDLSKSKNIVTMDDLSMFKRSPIHYEHYIKNIPSKKGEDETIKEKEQQATNFIKALQIYFMSPSAFHNTYKCLKEKDLPAVDKMGRKTYRLKENREYRDVTFPNMNQGKMILPEKDYDLLLAIGEANIENAYITLHCNEHAKGNWNQEKYVKDEKTGLVLKTASYFVPETPVLFDFQIGQSANIYSFPKTIFREGINNKMVWNMDQFHKKDFILFVIENKAPYICQSFVLDAQTVEKTKWENRMLLDILCWCKKKGVYPDYAQFNILKNLYRQNDCDQMNLSDTIERLDLIYGTMPDEITTSTYGVFNVEPPIWMK